ncbi:heparin lyase I family protein [Gloeocapsopsis crepidinum]|nr:heparin lyase I family protein [Gloeocapsopsis crepidinum]
MPQKNLFFRLSGLLLSTTLLLLMGANKSDAAIIDSVREDIATARSREFSKSKGGSACNRLENVTTFTGNTAHPVRAGKQAFLHWVNRCGERSELAMQRTVIGNTYWYGWSMFIPSNWENPADDYDILTQWSIYPNVPGRRMPCSAVGSYILRSGDSISFRLQRKGENSDSECTRYSLANLSEVRGKWVDFVMHTKWTGNSDGFLKLWMKVGNEPYVEKINYSGRTYWNDEGTGPYFKMGLYKGDPNFKGAAPRYLYTDEYRLGDANSSFEEVAPSGSSQVQPPPPPPPQLIFEDFSTSANNFTVDAGGSWSINSGKYLLRNTNSSLIDVPNGNITVHKTSVPTNFTLTADAGATAGSSDWDDFSVIFNYQNQQNYYYASFNESDNDGTHGLFKVVGGVATQIANFDNTIRGGATYNIKVEKKGSTVNVYRDNVLQAAVTDATFSGGRVGFGSRNNPATFDNLKVE